MLLTAIPLHRAWPLQQGDITQIVHKVAPTETVTITPTAAAAGSSIQVVAALTGFSLLGPTGQVNYTLTPSDGSTPITFSASLINGVATGIAIAPTHPVSYSLTAVYAGDNNYTQQTSSATGTVTAGPGTSLVVSAPATTMAGTPFNVSVTAQDAFGNVATGYTGMVHFTSTTGNAVLPADGPLTAGTGIFSATLKTVGSQTITSMDTVISSLRGTSSPIMVFAANLVVTTTTDDAGTASNCTPQTTAGVGTDSSCSLRDALTYANGAGAGNISFASSLFVAPQTIALTNGQIELSQNTTITGPGASLLTVSGNGGARLFYVDPSVTAHMSGLTLSNGAATASTPSGGLGGAFYDTGNLTLTGVVLSGNTATDNGGAIAVAAGGTLQIANSTLNGNTSGGSGGAISTSSQSTTTITGSTLSGNTAQVSGGAINNVGALSLTNSTIGGDTATTMQGGGIYSDQNSTVSLLQSTIVSNAATAQGGGIYLNSGVLTSQNSIVFGNVAGSYADIDAVNGAYTDGGGNVVNISSSGNSVNTGMTALGNFGGPSQTMMPVPSHSIAICAGVLSNLGELNVDQRGMPRTTAYNGTSCVDAGAVQTNYSIAFVTQPTNTTFGAAISPAPSVQINESGNPWNAASAQISISATAGTLTGAAAQNTSAGHATFSDITIAPIESNDTLVAVMQLASNLNEVATSAPFNVLPATPILIFSPIATQTYGNPSVQLSASSVSNGAVTYTVVSGPGTISSNGTTVTLNGAGTITVNASQAANGNYGVASATTSFAVAPATPVIAWIPAPTTFGTPLGAAQLDAAATFSANGSGVAGTYSYSPASGTLLGVGTHTLSVTFTPTDTNDFTTATKSVTLTVGQSNSTVNLVSSPNASIFGAPVTFTATLPAGATGTVTFSDNGTSIASVAIVGATASFTTSTLSGGSHPITAVYSGDANFIGSTSLVLTQVVNKATPAITWENPQPITYGTALSATQLDATASFASNPLSGTFTYSPASGTVLFAGTQQLSVTFTPNDSTNFTSVTKSVTLVVNKGTPGITWPAPASITYGTPLSSTQLDATAADANGNPIPGNYVYHPASGEILDGGIQPLSANFTPTDTSDFVGGVGFTQLTVVPATPTLVFTQIPNQPYVSTPITLSATSASTGAVTYAVVSGPATVSGNQLTLTAAGTVTLRATQAATANYTSATATMSFTTTVSVTLMISPGSPTTGTGNSNGGTGYGFNLTPSGGNIYPDQIVFSATGLPPGYTATFNPTMIPAGSSATIVTMSIQPPAKQARSGNPLPGGPVVPAALALMLLPLLGMKQVRRRFPLLLAVLALSLGATLGLSGCAGGGGGNSSPGTGSSSETYTIVVTATDTTTSMHVSTNVTYIVP